MHKRIAMLFVSIGFVAALCAPFAVAAARSSDLVFIREMFKLNGVQWQLASGQTVGGVTVYKDSSASPNRLWIYSNYALGAPNAGGVEGVGEIVLITQGSSGKPIAVRVVSDGDTPYVEIRGGELRVNGDLRVKGNLWLNGRQVQP